MAPEDWTEVRLAPHVNLQSGKAFPSTNFSDDPAVGPPLVRIRDLESGAPNTFYAGEVQDKHMIPTGAILVGMDGDFTAVRWEEEGCVLNQRVLRVATASPSLLDEEFLFYRLKRELPELQRIIGGTTVKHLSQKHIKNLRLSLPPLLEQKKIAAILSSVDDAITSTREVIEQTERVKKGLLQNLMTRGIGHTRFKQTEIGEIPEEWEVVRLGSLIKSLNPGVSVKSKDRTIEGNEVGVLKTGAVSEGRFLPSEHKVVLHEERDRVRVSPRAGRIIISRMNTRQLVGESGLVREDHPKLFLPDRLWQTEFYRSADVNPEWLALALTAPPIRERIRLLGTGTSGSMKNIAQTKFLSLKIPYPPTNEQEEMATAVRALQHTSVRAEKSVAKLSQLKRGLMQDLLTGRVRVPVD